MSGRLPERRFKHPIGPAVHRILWNAWDPIGVRNMGDWPDDEYDSYVWPIIRMIMTADPPEKIADYLDWAVSENMGMTGGNSTIVRQLHLDVAHKLVALNS